MVPPHKFLKISGNSKISLNMWNFGSAFTLLEILAVVAVLGIFAALAVPAMMGAMGRSKAATCASNLRQLYSALELHAADYNGRYPAAMSNEEVVPGIYETRFWQVYLFPYLGIEIPENADREFFQRQMREGVFWSPATEDVSGKQGRGLGTRSYAMNAFLPFISERLSYVFPLGSGYAISQQTGVLLSDTRGEAGKADILLLANHGAFEADGWTHPAIRWHTSWTGEGPEIPGFVHGGKKNVLFADGHVELCGPDDINSDLMRAR